MGDADTDAAIQEAHTLLSDVRGGKEIGLSDNTAVNRLYYACFHAARAVMFDRGITPKSHGGMENQLVEELAPEEITYQDVSVYSEMSDHRHRADYTYHPVVEDVDHLLEQTEAFVETMEQLLDADTDKNNSEG